MTDKDKTTQLRCPTCNGTRTIYFDHIHKQTYAQCPRCTGDRPQAR